MAKPSVERCLAMEIVASIAGVYVKPIEIAVKEFTEKGLNPEDYKIEVIKENDHWVVVVFSWMNAPQGQRGSPRGFPGYEVEIDMKTGKVIRQNFSR
jgi:hypothetical protein